MIIVLTQDYSNFYFYATFVTWWFYAKLIYTLEKLCQKELTKAKKIAIKVWNVIILAKFPCSQLTWHKDMPQNLIP